MKSQTETSGLAHLKSAHQLSAELTKISEISEHGRDKRRLKEESVRWDKKNLECCLLRNTVGQLKLEFDETWQEPVRIYYLAQGRCNWMSMQYMCSCIFSFVRLKVIKNIRISFTLTFSYYHLSTQTWSASISNTLVAVRSSVIYSSTLMYLIICNI